VHVAPSLPALRGGLTGWEVDREDLLRPVRDWLEEVTAGLDIERVVLSSKDPAAETARWARESGVDVLVTAAASTPIQRRVLGSFTASLAARGEVATLVVPVPEEGAGETGSPRDFESQPLTHVVCLLDDSPAADAALEEAQRLVGANPGARLTVVHAVLPPRPARVRSLNELVPAPPFTVRAGERWLEENAERFPEAEPVLVVGHPLEVTRWANEHEADVIVMGTRAHHSARLFGGLAKQIARESDVPVLLVPPRSDGGETAAD
jgi:nucleotide-binding universal stress UspA family protein